ncbi:hypothetical protein AVEN_59800-1 [Araneus ventricosus]|uniref:Histone-lysine N-methyltransferase SETMAR n=1 Tax=Araneus ventricosus TaxID=182803 RepID=A0A4Y2U361_ARAVE|nr:hypothetical protein AVEN_59800-1 [Araneus ventricosus]
MVGGGDAWWATAHVSNTVGQCELSCRHINMLVELADEPSVSCAVSFDFFKQKVGLWKTIDAAVSCQTLRRLRRAIPTSGVVLIRENSRPYNVVETQQLLEQFEWEVSDHPAYSPDLVTSDSHLFFELENWLGGQSFQKNGP